MDAHPRIAAASGRIDSLWDHTRRWNPYIAMRAFMYWSYQVTTKRGQNALHVVNVICGANTVFRIDVFGQLIDDDVPYAIDDMYWLAEIVRRDLGRVEYVHAARSWTIDPHTFRDWYRQTVRWSWAQFQSVRGHHLGSPLQRDRTRRLGFRFSWFDLAYLGLLLDWLPYMLEPLLIVPAVFLLSPWIDWQWFAIFYLATQLHLVRLRRRCAAQATAARARARAARPRPRLPRDDAARVREDDRPADDRRLRLGVSDPFRARRRRLRRRRPSFERDDLAIHMRRKRGAT